MRTHAPLASLPVSPLAIAACLALIPAATATAQNGSQPGTPSSAEIVINELSYNDSGADDAEFIELYNRSGAAVDIGGWQLVHDDDNGVNWTLTIPAGVIVNPGGFYVLGQSPQPGEFDLGPFPLQAGNEILILRRPDTTIEDTVAWGMARGPLPLQALVEGEGFQGDAFANQSGDNTTLSRHSDGQDTNDNGNDFRLSLATRGASNQTAHNVSLPYTLDFDGQGGMGDFSSSFVPPTAVAPGAGTPPASPAGGNIGSMFDPTGGGNTHHLNTAPITNVRMSMFVNLQTSGLSDGGQSWSFGVRGTADSFGDPTDVPQAAGDPSYYATLGTTYQSGLTGIAWSFFQTAAGGTLYLVDYNNGGGDPIVLESIPIIAGENDGWHNLRIVVQGENLIAGIDTAEYLHTTEYINAGSCWVAYRELVSNNAEIGFYVDNIFVEALSATADVDYYGNGSTNALGKVPQIHLGNPIKINTILRVVGEDLAPSNLVILGIAATPDIAGTPLFGAPSAFRLHLGAIFDVRLGVSGPGGDVQFFQVIPQLPPSAITLRTYIQLVEYDVSLVNQIPGIGLPIAGSRAILGIL